MPLIYSKARASHIDRQVNDKAHPESDCAAHR
jgi:hypothetical protein